MKNVLALALCMVGLAGFSVDGEVMDGGATLTVAGANTYTGSAAVTGGTLTLGGSIAAGTGTSISFYSGKVERVSASGKVTRGSVHVNFSAQSGRVNGHFTLPGHMVPLGTDDTVTDASGSDATATIMVRKDKQISFEGRYHPETGRGFIRQTWVDPQTKQVVYKPGAEKMPIRYLGGRLFGKLVDAKGNTMSFHSHLVSVAPNTTSILSLGATTIGNTVLNLTTGSVVPDPTIGVALPAPTPGE